MKTADIKSLVEAVMKAELRTQQIGNNSNILRTQDQHLGERHSPDNRTEEGVTANKRQVKAYSAKSGSLQNYRRKFEL